MPHSPLLLVSKICQPAEIRTAIWGNVRYFRNSNKAHCLIRSKYIHVYDKTIEQLQLFRRPLCSFVTGCPVAMTAYSLDFYCTLNYLWVNDNISTVITSVIYTVRCRYDAVKYVMILRTILQNQQQNINHTLNSQKTTHTSPSRAGYGESILRTLEKIDRVITTSHCTCYWLRLFLSEFYLFLLLTY